MTGILYLKLSIACKNPLHLRQEEGQVQAAEALALESQRTFETFEIGGNCTALSMHPCYLRWGWFCEYFMHRQFLSERKHAARVTAWEKEEIVQIECLMFVWRLPGKQKGNRRMVAGELWSSASREFTHLGNQLPSSWEHEDPSATGRLQYIRWCTPTSS